MTNETETKIKHLFICNMLKHDQIFKGGFIILKPGAWRRISKADLEDPSISHALSEGRAELVEASEKPEDIDLGAKILEIPQNKPGATYKDLTGKDLEVQSAEMTSKVFPDQDAGKKDEEVESDPAAEETTPSRTRTRSKAS